jgi:hypothetical protein
MCPEFAPRLPVLLALCLAAGVGCSSENPTEVVADNDYPAVPDGGDSTTEMTVYKVWWMTTLMPDAVMSGDEGQPQRTVPGAGVAYAVLAPGWDPRSAAPPSRFLAARSAASLTAKRGDTLHVRVSDATFDGNCAAGNPLSQAEADFVTERIFPAEFAGLVYDAATCSARLAPEGGADADEIDAADDADATDAGVVATGGE